MIRFQSIHLGLESSRRVEAVVSRQRGGHQDERKPGDESQTPHQTEDPLVGHRRRYSSTTGSSFSVDLVI